MKKIATSLLIGFIFFSVPIAAKAQAASPRPAAGKPNLALLFGFTNFLATVAPYGDGFQTGAGMKFWINGSLGLRGLVSTLVDPSSGSTTTTVGISAALEYHPKAGNVSPYFGGIVAIQSLLYSGGSYFDFAIGALGGVEARLFGNFAFFAEYQALLINNTDGMGFELGTKPVLGFAIYF